MPLCSVSVFFPSLLYFAVLCFVQLIDSIALCNCRRFIEIKFLSILSDLRFKAKCTRFHLIFMNNINPSRTRMALEAQLNIKLKYFDYFTSHFQTFFSPYFKSTINAKKKISNFTASHNFKINYFRFPIEIYHDEVLASSQSEKNSVSSTEKTQSIQNFRQRYVEELRTSS